MEHIFLNPETKIQIEEDNTEPFTPIEREVSSNLGGAVERLLQFFSDPKIDAGWLAETLALKFAPKEDSLAKQSLELSLREDIREIQNERIFLHYINPGYMTKNCKCVEIDFAPGEICGIEAPPSGLKVVITEGQGHSRIRSFVGSSITSEFLIPEFCSLGNYQGKALLITNKICMLLTYKLDSHTLFFEELRSENRLGEALNLEKGKFLRDGTSTPPTLVYISPETKSVIRFGKILEGTPPRLERLFEIDTVFTFSGLIRPEVLLRTSAIDEFGRIWFVDDRLRVLGPDFELLGGFMLKSGLCKRMYSRRGRIYFQVYNIPGNKTYRLEYVS